MISNKKKQGLGEYGLIVKKDGYSFRNYPKDHFDFIFDIGANLGIFSVYAKMLHPETPVIALEPCKETFGYLQKNCDGLGVDCVQEALGADEKLYFKDVKHLTGNLFVEDEEAGYEVNSMSLTTLFKRYGVDPKKHKVYLKLDCEGGERFLMNAKDEALLKHVDHVGMEIHFSYKNPSFIQFPKWEEYVAWVERVFSKTHILKYGNSNRTRSVGMYNIVKRIG